MPYIVCEKRKGNPKVNVEVCRRKCKFVEECVPYRQYLKATVTESSLDVDSHATVHAHEGGTDDHVQAA